MSDYGNLTTAQQARFGQLMTQPADQWPPGLIRWVHITGDAPADALAAWVKMGDLLLNGRKATDWELAAVGHGRKCDLKRDLRQLAGLLAEYPRPAEPASRPVTDLPVLP